MFKRKKKIDEYMRISNGVRIPGGKEKIINLNERRKNGMKKKGLLSAAMVAVVSGIVLFTNIGAGMGGADVSIDGIKVYASESGSENKGVELKKGTKTEIKSEFKVFEDTKKGAGLITQGITLDIQSKDLESVKVKANKGGFTEFIKKLGKDEDGKLIESKAGDNGENKAEAKSEVTLEKVEGKATIEYAYSEDMVKNLEDGKKVSEVLNGVEIEIEGTYKGGEKTKNILKLSVEGGKIIAELK